MKPNNDTFFEVSNFTLFLFLFLFQSFSYGETKQNSLSENQISEQQTIETFSEELPREDSGYSNQTRSSQWSIKGELLASFPIPAGRINPVIPISLEFQTPIGMENKLNWLVQAGGGMLFVHDPHPAEPYLSLDAGLIYDFQFLTLSLTLGGMITSSFLEGINDDTEESIFLIHPALIPIKWAFSIGREFSNEIHIALTAGSFATIFMPFLGISVSIPLKT